MHNDTSSAPAVAALIAAAGRSMRMGEPKQLLPWNNGTVIESAVRHLHEGGAAPILCVVGHQADEVQRALHQVPSARSPVHVVRNPDYRSLEMLSSYQVGIQALWEYEAKTGGAPCVGALFALGDQPHIPSQVIRKVVDQTTQTPDAPVIPSYNMRRGHPFYLPRMLLIEITQLTADETLRTVLRRYNEKIVYVNVDTDAILRDMDTPADYDSLRAEQ